MVLGVTGGGTLDQGLDLTTVLIFSSTTAGDQVVGAGFGREGERGGVVKSSRSLISSSGRCCTVTVGSWRLRGVAAGGVVVVTLCLVFVQCIFSPLAVSLLYPH